jgi:hypothetical protein
MKKHQSTIYSVYLCMLQQTVDSVMSKLNVYVCYNRTWIQSCPSSTFMCATTERGFSHVQAQRLCVLQQNVNSVMSKLNVYVWYKRTWIQPCPSSTFMNLYICIFCPCSVYGLWFSFVIFKPFLFNVLCSLARFL